MDFPKLRELEAFPVTASGQRLIGLRDPMNLTKDVMVFPQQLYPMLCLFDGRHSIVDIQAEYMRRFGELVYRETIEEVVNKLDASLFLENENFRTKRTEIENEFKRATSRSATLAGKSYNESPDKLAEQIKGFFEHPEGPSLPQTKKNGNNLKGIIAPHIDFVRGGPCFA
ncbi:MAG: MEMO1 family protein, partial [Candidatus Hydrogenedentota bacterium]